jgi:hypothetical protein
MTTQNTKPNTTVPRDEANADKAVPSKESKAAEVGGRSSEANTGDSAGDGTLDTTVRRD